jgi:hypothetical protein
MVRGYVIVSGPPASGKSTLGPVLARELGCGAEAMSLLIAAAAEVECGVLDGSWLRDRTPQMVRQLPARVVEVFCRCHQELLEERYLARSAQRGVGHFDRERSWAELWGVQTAEPVAGGWPVIEVDTTQPVDIAQLSQRPRAALNDGHV